LVIFYGTIITMLNIFIIEDEPTIGRLLKQSVESSDIRATLFLSGTEALSEIARGNRPDIILMDINLPDISGIDLTALIKDKYPDIEIIMQTVNEDSNSIINAIEAGASGYILKTSSVAEIMMAIDIVRDGGSFLTGKIARKILQRFKTKTIKINSATRFDLTHREKEILDELVKGLSDKEISAQCGITIHGVNKHLRQIYQKMQVNSRGEAVSKATMNISDELYI